MTRPKPRAWIAGLVLAVTGASCIPEPDPVPPGSYCHLVGSDLVCPHRTIAFDVEGEHREVHWAAPSGSPPASGWPTVVMFQGSFITAEFTWQASKATPYGAYYQTQTAEFLLDHGYAVLTPETHLDGAGQWDTNDLLFPDYEASNDHAFMLAILNQLEAGTFGALDHDRLFAAGISSGGHMTSRMAVSYPGQFRALAIQSASYATCAGWICDVGPVPPDHPPTLFLHGERDLVVPVSSMQEYADALAVAGIATRVVLDPDAGHEWIPPAPAEVLAWFDQHR